MKRGKTLKTLQRECKEFNANVAIGDIVEYTDHPGAEMKMYRTRTEAEILSGHTAVVWLDGKSGCVCISHCKPLGAEING